MPSLIPTYPRLFPSLPSPKPIIPSPGYSHSTKVMLSSASSLLTLYSYWSLSKSAKPLTQDSPLPTPPSLKERAVYGGIIGLNTSVESLERIHGSVLLGPMNLLTWGARLCAREQEHLSVKAVLIHVIVDTFVSDMLCRIEGIEPLDCELTHLYCWIKMVVRHTKNATLKGVVRSSLS